MANSGNSVSSPPEKQAKTNVCREIDFGPSPPNHANQPRETHKHKSPTENPTEPKFHPKIINIVSSSDNTISAAGPIRKDDGGSIRQRTMEGPSERKRRCKMNSKPNKKRAQKGTCSTTHVSGGQRFQFVGHDRNDMSITLTSSNHGDRGLAFVMKPKSTLRYPCKHYAECIDVCPLEIKLYKDGKELNKNGTAESNGLKDGDQIIVEGVDPFSNMDTRYKLITIQDMMPQQQMSLQHMAPVTLTMEELHQLWATFAEKVPESFVLVYNGVDIRRSQKTVAEAKFMNEDIIYCRSKDPAQSSGTLGSSDY